jgi:fructose-bisphosphate aldolase class I
VLRLHEIAIALVAPGKGILAADESIATMSRRLEAVGVAPSAGTRREYRQLLLTTPALADWVYGIILSDETLSQELSDGTPFGDAATSLPAVFPDTRELPARPHGGHVKSVHRPLHPDGR